MSFLIVRSVVLSEESMEAWRAVGGTFPRRERGFPDIAEMVHLRRSRSLSPVYILNMGNTMFNPSEEQIRDNGIDPNCIFNLGKNIKPLVTPGGIRQRMGELLPAYPTSESLPILVWVKAPGSKGNGKEKKMLSSSIPEIPRDWDIQVHVPGTEYRVITVDHAVVQTFQRIDESGHREYSWVGVKNCPREVKNIAREGTRKLEGRNIIGWDIMLSETGAYILEGNSCPGMTFPTAQRIVTYILQGEENNADNT